LCGSSCGKHVLIVCLAELSITRSTGPHNEAVEISKGVVIVVECRATLTTYLIVEALMLFEVSSAEERVAVVQVLVDVPVIVRVVSANLTPHRVRVSGNISHR
jgi:hypothetical protein